ncbi:MAG: ankyrin repeat domain-containing protein [Gammaproteobacteria bacterium]|nr:ankyrin repeat domain-containing protein [Gammaproteobacteria bacterium]
MKNKLYYFPLLLGLFLTACTGNQYTELQLAAARGQADRIQTILDRGGKVDEPNQHGRTPLMLAADFGHHEAVRVLLKNNAFMNAQDIDGMTALMIAAADGHTDTIKVLLEYGADPNIVNNYDATALTNSVFFGHIDASKALLEGKTRFTREASEKALLIVSGLGHVEIIKLLLDYGVDVNANGKNKRTPVMAAINFDHVGSVETLLKKGARTDAMDSDGITVMELAKDKGNPQIVALIEKYSKNISPRH